MEVEWCWAGRVPYGSGVRRLEGLRREVLALDLAGVLVMMEHDAVITAGRHADAADLALPAERLGAMGVELVRASRGGRLTWHGPGQLMVYPVVSLRRLRIGGVRRYVELLTGALAAWLTQRGLAAAPREDEPGVWVGEPPSRKIASVGVHVHRDVTLHGAALNLANDLEQFALLRPCGMSASVMTSLEREVGASPPVELAAGEVAAVVATALGCRLVRRDGLW